MEDGMLLRIGAAVVMMFVASAVNAQDTKKFEITPELQKQIDDYKAIVAKWAADPVIVQAVVDQNKKGPIDGLDNKKWATLRRRSSEITAFQTCPAGKQLTDWLQGTNGAVSEAFLNAAQGEKVAFVEKTSSYIHAGKSKFDVPFKEHKNWQGKPELDESSQTYSLQVSVPVVQKTKVEGEEQPKEEVVGVLVVGLNLAVLQAATPAPGK
jgi:hypothetical protein